jgi:hypothetical protein
LGGNIKFIAMEKTTGKEWEEYNCKSLLKLIKEIEDSGGEYVQTITTQYGEDGRLIKALIVYKTEI